MTPRGGDRESSGHTRWLAHFNRLVGNKVQGLWAPYLPPWAVIVHVGRVSKRQYRDLLERGTVT